MEIPDYIPDVEPSKPRANPKPGNGSPTPETVKDLGKVWGDSLPDPMSFAEAVTQFDRVVKFGWRVIDSICHGTCPPADVMVPDLYKAIDDAKKIRDGFTVFVERGAGNVVWNASDPRYQRAKSVGLNVFFQSDKVLTKAGETSIEQLDPRKYMQKKKDEWSFWKGALMVVLGISAIATFKGLIETIRGDD